MRQIEGVLVNWKLVLKKFVQNAPQIRRKTRGKNSKYEFEVWMIE